MQQNWNTNCTTFDAEVCLVVVKATNTGKVGGNESSVDSTNGSIDYEYRLGKWS